MVSSLGIAEPLIICCQQDDWHNQTQNTLLLSKDLGAFLKHLMNEAIRISTVCTKQELGSNAGDCIRGSSDYMCLLAAACWHLLGLKSVWYLWFFRVTKPSCPAKAEPLAGVDSKGHLQIFCCLGSC